VKGTILPEQILTCSLMTFAAMSGLGETHVWKMIKGRAVEHEGLEEIL
jgi:hypothetical protein